MVPGYYLVHVQGGIEPSLVEADGHPVAFPGVDAQIAAAKAMHRWIHEDDVLFWLDIDANGVPHIGSFDGMTFEEESLDAR